MAFSLGWKSPSLSQGLLQAIRNNGFLLCRWRATGNCLDPEILAFLEENTEVTSNGSLTPEIQLRLLTPRCKFWWEKADLWPYGDPYWAIYWPGGQALSRYCSIGMGTPPTPHSSPQYNSSKTLSLCMVWTCLRGESSGKVISIKAPIGRYLLDNPDIVRGKSVLDLGSGCGATAIAAKMSGAYKILANDIDPIAGMAITLNCKLNRLSPFPILTKNILNMRQDKWDLIVLGDMFYDEDLANRLQQWLENCFRTYRTQVLIGDPGRPQLTGHSIQRHLHQVVEYTLPELTKQENNGLTTSTVWDFRP